MPVALREIDDAVEVATTGVAVVAGISRPPQPTSVKSRALAKKSCIRLTWVSCTGTSDNIRPLHRDVAKRN